MSRVIALSSTAIVSLALVLATPSLGWRAATSADDGRSRDDRHRPISLRRRHRDGARRPLRALGPAGRSPAMPVGVSFGLGTIGELQLDTGYTWFDIDSRTDAPLAFRVPADATRTAESSISSVATKIRRARGEAPSSRDRRPLRDAAAERQQRERPRAGHHRFFVQHPGRQDGRIRPRRRQRGSAS